MRRRGFTLLEMLVALVVLAVIAAMVDRVFMQSMRGIADQQVRHWHDRAEQSLVDHLRADVWTSTSAQVAGGELHLESNSAAIVYRIQPQQVRRMAPGEVDMVWEYQGGAEFAASGGLITLKAPALERTFVAPLIGRGGRP